VCNNTDYYINKYIFECKFFTPKSKDLGLQFLSQQHWGFSPKLHVLALSGHKIGEGDDIPEAKATGSML